MKEFKKPLGGPGRFLKGTREPKPPEEPSSVVRAQFGGEGRKETAKKPGDIDAVIMLNLASDIIQHIKAARGIEVDPNNEKSVKARDRWTDKSYEELIVAAQESIPKKWETYPEFYLELAYELRKRAKRETNLPE
jgi:hypothetical protein